METLPAEHYDYYLAFNSFNDVVESCFGNELYPGYEECIAKFEAAYTKLGLAVTPKVHLLTEHAIEDIEEHGLGLGLFNESAAESLHADFDRFYQRYAVKDIHSDAYLRKLQMAVSAYNASHM